MGVFNIFRFPKDEELTLDDLKEFLDEHSQIVNKRYKPLLNAYMSDHDILHQRNKPPYKPDNRIVVNFPKYIVDTFNGFFVGHPIKTTAKSDAVAEAAEFIERYNDIDNENTALATNSGIFGKCYEMYFTDEEAELCIVYLTPIDAFMIYDESILKRPLYFIRRYTDRNNIERGSISDAYGVRHFKITGGMEWTDEEWQPHFFKGVPAVEFKNNEVEQGLFEPCLTDINAYNKAISEKANDVDYFADAYMKVLGAPVGQEDVQFIRDNRIVNFYGDDAEKIIAEFMDKPASDTTQENLLNRLERHIFQIAMVANISDENFGGSSGTALQYRVLNMSNLMEDKKRRFTSALNKRYKLLFGHPASKVPADSWMELDFKFTPNLPKNILEEAQIAASLEGIVSHETQLETLSIVDNVKEELDRIEEENKASEETIVDRLMFGNVQQAENPEQITEGVENGQ